MDDKFGGYDRRFTGVTEVLENNGSSESIGKPKLIGAGTGVINWKTIEFWMGSATGNKTESYNGRTNWRTINLGGIDFRKKPVSSNVVLIPEQTEFKVESEVKWKDEGEDVGGGAGGILDAIKTGVEIFTGTTARPEWSARSFSDLGPMGLNGEYTFKFAYGKFGLFNAFEEVVKPILALTLFFGVEALTAEDAKDKNTWDGHLLSAAANISNPAPTHAQFLAERVKGAVGTLKSFNFNSEGASLASAMKEANYLIQSALAAGARNVSTSGEWRNCYMSWGRFMFGPFNYGKVSYSFDQKNMDSNGWPTLGQFTISDIKSMRRSTTQAMISPLVRGV